MLQHKLSEARQPFLFLFFKFYFIFKLYIIVLVLPNKQILNARFATFKAKSQTCVTIYKIDSQWEFAA